MKYRVKIRNAKDCRVIISFPDLCVKYSNGFSPVLKLNEGEEIPLDVCDPEDVRKSWIVGSLRGYKESGWIEEIIEEKKEEEKPLAKSNFITEQKMLEETSKQVIPPQSPQPILSESVVNKSVEEAPSDTLDLNKIVSLNDFLKLTQFLKLRFIKECNNLDLLKEIFSTTTSTQIKNHIQLRLTNIKI